MLYYKFYLNIKQPNEEWQQKSPLQNEFWIDLNLYLKYNL